MVVADKPVDLANSFSNMGTLSSLKWGHQRLLCPALPRRMMFFSTENVWGEESWNLANRKVVKTSYIYMYMCIYIYICLFVYLFIY